MTARHVGGWAKQLLADSELRAAAEGARKQMPGVGRGRRQAGEALAWLSAMPNSRGLQAAPGVPARTHNPIPAVSLEEALARHPFLHLDPGTKRLRGESGAHRVVGSLVLPGGYGLDLPPGTTLRFGVREILLASGPLRFLGTAEKPVTLEGISGGTWQGLVSLSSPSPHRWQNTVVRNTTGIERESWLLTGGVTIRRAELQIEEARFAGNRAEDAVNLVHCRFAFRNIVIEDVPSDAFDCDFCEGRVVGGLFQRIGGDGIDVSGSKVQVEGAILQQIQDKAISVGEESELTARRVKIDRVGTALASKDGSSVTFEDSTVSNVEHAAIMAYRKKLEYGPAEVSVRSVVIGDAREAAVAQRGSRIVIDGIEQEPVDLDVQGLYEHGYMKK